MAKDIAEVKADIYEPQIFSMDDFPETPDEEGEVETEEKVAKEPEPEEEIEVEGKGKTVEKEEDEVTKLRKELREMKDEMLRVSSAPKPKEEKRVEEEKPLTDSQLAGIIKENKDNPEVLLNVFNYVAEQKAKTIANATRDETLTQQWQAQLSGQANRIISEDADGYLAANPRVKAELGTYARNLGLADHPVGELAALAIMRMSEMQSGKTKADEKSPTVKEKLTSSRVMDKTRTTNKSDKVTGLSEEQLKVAKQFGVNPKTYARFVKES